MRDLKFLITYTFLGGIFLISFIDSLTKDETLLSICYLTMFIIDMLQVLEFYNRIKVRK